ncbi:MAG: RDD family protein [Oscillospiraceae bacterium]|nr:RDD family protein [Oscillospiraceae bacterium]
MDLQRANSWKRIAAWILDLMLLCVLAVGTAYGVSVITGYDAYDQKLQAAYDHYEEQYGVTFDVDQATYEAMTQEEKANYDAAYDALIADEEAMYSYNMLVNLSMLMTTLGILVATLVLEFAVPLVLKNGQTIGKKCFSLGVMRIDGVKISPLQLFARTLLGKFTIETMVPVFIVMMILWGSMGITGTVVLLALLVVQVICVAVGGNRAAIHDRLAGTVVVDISSQKIFETADERIAYINRIQEEKAKKQDY